MVKPMLKLVGKCAKIWVLKAFRCSCRFDQYPRTALELVFTLVFICGVGSSMTKEPFV